MNKTARFLSIAAVAAFASFGAQADEADASQFATKFETNRTRAEVQAEAATVAQTRSIEPAGSWLRICTAVAASLTTSARVRLVSNWVANCEASASSAWAPKEAKAATAAMERKRAVLFMMKILG